MRIACLQFNPQVGDVDNNMTRADRVLSKGDTENLDLIVLPEMAFSGKRRRPSAQISARVGVVLGARAVSLIVDSYKRLQLQVSLGDSLLP